MNEEIKVTEKAQEVEVTTEQTQTEPMVTEYLPVAEYLGLDHPSEQEKAQLSEIYKFFADEGMKPEDVKWAIRDKELRYRSPVGMGQTRLAKLYELVTLNKEALKVEERLKKL